MISSQLLKLQKLAFLACKHTDAAASCAQQTRRASACKRNSAGVFCPDFWIYRARKEVV
jgi:hypothetical protein